MAGPSFESMTTFELVQVYYLAKGAAIEDVTISITILFAFVAAAYIAGMRLKLSQALGITTLYSLVLLFQFFNLYQDLVVMNATLIAMYGEDNVGNEMYVSIALLSLCWLYSLYFLFDVRRDEIA